MKKIRQLIFNAIENVEDKKGLPKYLDLFLILLICLNIIAVILESVQSIHDSYSDLFDGFQTFSIVVFTLEYFSRVWSIVEHHKYKHPVKGRLRFAFTPMAIIDLLSILPFYLASFAIDLRHLRILRLFRFFRLFKIARYVKALDVISAVIRKKKAQLIISLVFIIFMLLIVSSIMFHLEHEAQPEKFSSIPETMWWGVVTFSTIGYGDMYPITDMGRILAGVIAILGIGLFALPTGILVSGFTEHIENK
ncbi:MAG: potassium channel family protein [Flavobacteriaceae bacterium]